MSTSWWPKCIDPICEVDDSDDWCNGINHGEETIRELYRHRYLFREIEKLLEPIGWWVTLEVAEYCASEYRYIMSHLGHHLVLKNEYGERESIEEPYFTYYTPGKYPNNSLYFSYWLPRSMS